MIGGVPCGGSIQTAASARAHRKPVPRVYAIRQPFTSRSVCPVPCPRAPVSPTRRVTPLSRTYVKRAVHALPSACTCYPATLHIVASVRAPCPTRPRYRLVSRSPSEQPSRVVKLGGPKDH
eukprot:6244109-Prymnesium_polylepis.1